MTVLKCDDWRMSWRLTERNGLVLHDCAFRGLRVARSMHIPFIYLRYDGPQIGAFTDHLVSRRSKVEVRSVTQGFDIATRYDGYGADYLYEQVCRFNADGSFGIRMVIYGPGEDNDGGHTYYYRFVSIST